MRNNFEYGQFNRYMDGLISIPEKVTTPFGRSKATLQTECSPKQKGQKNYQSPVRLEDR